MTKTVQNFGKATMRQSQQSTADFATFQIETCKEKTSQIAMPYIKQS